VYVCVCAADAGASSLSMTIDESSQLLYVCEQAHQRISAVSIAQGSMGLFHSSFSLPPTVEGGVLEHICIDPIHRTVYVTDSHAKSVFLWRAIRVKSDD
jgi:hypothetical protein